MSNVKMAKRRVILDIDAGTDDAFALILLLHKEKNIDIVGITCVNGNTSIENVYNNVTRLLKLCEREEIPVYVGASKPLITSDDDGEHYFHGKDGFGDLEYEEDGITVKQHNLHNKNRTSCSQNAANNCLQKNKENAIFMLNKIVDNNPGQISLVCLGPLTNIALAIKINSNFTQNVKDIHIMGGNYKAVGNVTSTAEFNFHVDPEAAYIVLQNPKCPVTILPWEPCLDSNITFDWRYKVLGVLNHPALDLLNAAEKSIYAVDEKIWLPCDAFLAAIFLHPEIAQQSNKCKASVELRGHKTRAQMVVQHMDQKEPNICLVTEINMDLFKSLLIHTFSNI